MPGICNASRQLEQMVAVNIFSVVLVRRAGPELGQYTLLWGKDRTIVSSLLGPFSFSETLGLH